MKTNNKIHYIVASHGRLSEGYKNTVECIANQKNLHAVTAYVDEEFPENIQEIISSFSKDDKVVIFTDILCGSVTQKIMELYGNNENYHIFVGVNLALVLEVMLNEEELNDKKCEEIVEMAKGQICYLKNI